MSKTKALMTIFAAMAMSGDDSFLRNEDYKKNLTDEEKAELKSIAKRKRNKKRGLTEFNYGKNKTIWALNQKNADRKARKKGYL